jgi:hypothetical protein
MPCILKVMRCVWFCAEWSRSDWRLTLTPKKVGMSQNDEVEVLTTGAVCSFWPRIPDVE